MLAHADSTGRRFAASAAQLTARRPHRMRVAVGAGVAVGLAVVAGGLTRPVPARAEVPIVGPVVKTIGGIGHAVLHPAEAVVEALLKVLQAIFGGVEAKLITAVVNGLLAIPRFDSGHVAALEHTTVAIAAGMLSAVLTLSILRYYLAGLSDSGSGGFEAIQGLIRVIGAVGLIIAWPGIFAELIEIPKAFDAALLGSGSVQHNVALLFDAALVVGAGAFAIGTGLGLIFVVLIGFIAAVVFIALLWMKVLLSVLMMFLYVSMPLCIVLWPVQELSWLAVSAMRAMFVALIVPCVWAILFALSAAVNADVLTWAPSHSIVDTVIIRPLAGITLMLLCITIPRFLMRTAMIGPHGQAGGGWRIWRTLTFGMFAMRGAAGAGRTVATAAMEGHPAAQRMIDALPSQMRPPAGPGQGSLAGRVVFGRAGFTEDAKGKRTGQVPSGEGNAGGAGESTQAAGEQHIKAEMRLPGVSPASFDRERIDRAGQEMYDQAGYSPSSPAAVRAAMAKFPEQTQRAIAGFRANDYQKLRDLMAHNLHSPSLSEDQHQALWTIGSARNREAQQGIDAAIAVLDEGQASQAHATGSRPATTQGSPPASEPQAGGVRAGARAGGGESSRPASQSGAPAPPSPEPPTSPLPGPPSEPEQGGRSLGTDLPQQPPPPARSGDSPGLADIEPFLD